MKKLLLTKLFTAIAVTSAMAIDIPKGVYRADEVDEARAEAAEDGVAVAYIYFPEKIKKS